MAIFMGRTAVDRHLFDRKAGEGVAHHALGTTASAARRASVHAPHRCMPVASKFTCDFRWCRAGVIVLLDGVAIRRRYRPGPVSCLRCPRRAAETRGTQAAILRYPDSDDRAAARGIGTGRWGMPVSNALNEAMSHLEGTPDARCSANPVPPARRCGSRPDRGAGAGL